MRCRTSTGTAGTDPTRKFGPARISARGRTACREGQLGGPTGIVVATAAVIFYNYFSNLIKRFVEDLEYYGDELTNLVTDRVAHS